MFHSEYGQDEWLHNNVFRGKRNGVFVEAGALDGVLHSNTLFFEEQLGWTGLLIEAEPRAFADLARHRPNCHRIHAALYDETGKTLKFEAIDGGLRGWSGVVESMEAPHRKRIDDRIAPKYRDEIEVQTLTLDDALRVTGLREIDYLSLDVEGAEERILGCFPFGSYKIGVVAVEDNFGNPKLHELMTSHGYGRMARIGVDNIYMKQPK